MAININIPSQFREYNNFAAFPTTGDAKILYVAKNNNKLYRWDTSVYVEISPQLASSWGSITGNISDQTDLQSAIDTKVDKVTGKGLSTEDYTTTEKSKLAGIQAGAEVNVNADWNAVSGDAQILNKPTIPSIAGLATTSYVDSQDATKQDVLVSGTNVKTVEGQSILGSGDISITKSDIGLGNVDNTSDLSKPISTAQQTALNAKQDTLVSATNIKTINGSSVLGSGDLVVGGGGGGTHTPFKFNTYNSFYATSAAFNNSNVGVFAFQSNFMITYPFIPKFGFTCTQLYINVTSLAVGSLGRISIYQDSNGLPVTKLYESADLDLSTGGQKTATTSFVFTAGTVYWLAFQCNTITTTIISGIPVANCINFAFNGTTPINSFTRTVTFGTNAPTPFTPQASGSNILPFIGLRI